MLTRPPRPVWPALLAGLAVLLLVVLGAAPLAAIWAVAAAGAGVVVYVVRNHPLLQALLGVFLTVGCVLATFLGGLFFVPAALALLAIAVTGGVGGADRGSPPRFLPRAEPRRR